MAASLGFVQYMGVWSPSTTYSFLLNQQQSMVTYNGVSYATIATPTTGISPDADLAWTVMNNPATTSYAGVVQPDGTTITVSNGIISSTGGGTLVPATTTTLGASIYPVGSNINVDIDGNATIFSASINNLGVSKPDGRYLDILATNPTLLTSMTASQPLVGVTEYLGTDGDVYLSACSAEKLYTFKRVGAQWLPFGSVINSGTNITGITSYTTAGVIIISVSSIGAPNTFINYRWNPTGLVLFGSPISIGYQPFKIISYVTIAGITHVSTISKSGGNITTYTFDGATYTLLNVTAATSGQVVSASYFAYGGSDYLVATLQTGKLLSTFSLSGGWQPYGSDVSDRKSTRLNSSHSDRSRMPSSA